MKSRMKSTVKFMLLITIASAIILSAALSIITGCDFQDNYLPLIVPTATPTPTPDETVPSASIEPESGTVIQGLDQPIIVHFTESMNMYTIEVEGTMGNECYKEWLGNNLPFDTVILRPTTEWTEGWNQSLTVKATDIAGNTIDLITAKYIIDFTSSNYSVSPPAGSNITDALNTIVVEFQEAMAPETLHLSGSMADESKANWTERYEANDTLTLTPVTAWSEYYIKTLTIEVNDLVGNSIVPINLYYRIDYTPPTIIQNDVTPVYTETIAEDPVKSRLLEQVELQFSETIQDLGEDATFVLSGGNGSVTIDSIQGDTITLNIAGTLDGDADYILTVYGLEDAVGNPMVSPETITFHTYEYIRFAKQFGGVDNDIGYSIDIWPYDPSYPRNIPGGTDYGFAVVGKRFVDDEQNEDVYFIKTDESGNVLVEETYGGTENDVGVSIKLCHDESYIIAGYSESSPAAAIYPVPYTAGTNFSTGGNREIYVVKIDADGVLQWEVKIGGPDEDQAFDVIEVDDSYFIVVGYVTDSQPQLFACRITAAGAVVWNYMYTISAGYEEGRSVIENSAGDFIVGGITSSGSNKGCMVASIDVNGNLNWARNHDVSTSQDEVNHIIPNGTTSYVFIGSSYAAPNPNMILREVQTDGTDFGTPIEANHDFVSTDFGYCIEPTSDGKYIAVGQSYISLNFRINLVKLNSDLTIDETFSAGDSSLGYAYIFGSFTNQEGRGVKEVIVDGSSRGYIITGASQFPETGSDLVLIKTDPDGDAE